MRRISGWLIAVRTWPKASNPHPSPSPATAAKGLCGTSIRLPKRRLASRRSQALPFPSGYILRGRRIDRMVPGGPASIPSSDRAESDGEPKLSRTRMPSRNRTERAGRRLASPTRPNQPYRGAVRRRQLLSAFVLRPPCSRKWPILGGHGVKSLRRVRSVSTISRFFEFRLSRIQLMWTRNTFSTLVDARPLGWTGERSTAEECRCRPRTKLPGSRVDRPHV
jgi:hypothetical protein